MSNKIRNIAIGFFIFFGTVIMVMIMCYKYGIIVPAEETLDEVAETAAQVSTSASKAAVIKPVSNYDYSNTDTSKLQPKVYEVDSYKAEPTVGKETWCEIKFLDNASISIEVSDKDKNNKYISIYTANLKLSDRGNYISDDDNATLTFISDSQFQIYFENYPTTNQPNTFIFNKN